MTSSPSRRRAVATLLGAALLAAPLVAPAVADAADAPARGLSRALVDRSSHARTQSMPLRPVGAAREVRGTRPTTQVRAQAVAEASAPQPASVPGVNRTPGYRALSPARVLDTRSGNGAPRGTVGPGARIDVVVLGRGGVPTTGVAAVALNVTATGATASTFVSVYPATSAGAAPTVSNLNVPRAATVANTVVVAPGSGGKVRLLNAAGSVNLVADVAGYFEVGGSYHGLTPSRLLDTRTGNGAPRAVVGPGRQVDVVVTGRGGVPASGVSSVALTVTAVAPTASTAVTVFPTGDTPPRASNLNTTAGRTVAVAVLATVGSGGRVSIRNSAGSTHLLADVAGYFTTGGAYVPLAPSRRFDTRDQAGPPLGPGQYVDLLLPGTSGVSVTDATAVALSVTAVSPTGPGYVSVLPYTPAFVEPRTSSVNYARGQTTANLVIATVGAAGWVRLYNPASSTHLVVDVLGYFTNDATASYPLGRVEAVAVREDGRAALTSLAQATEAPVSGDGRWVLFAGTDPALVPYGVDNGVDNALYLRDVVLGRTVAVAFGAPGAGMTPLGLTPDGRIALFSTATQYFLADGNFQPDVFAYDLVTGDFLQVTWNDAVGTAPSGSSPAGAMSSDARWFVFQSTASDIGLGYPADGLEHVYRLDLSAPVSSAYEQLAAGSVTTQGVSDSGRVALTGTASPSGALVWDEATGYAPLSVATDGTVAAGDGSGARISRDGQVATFTTDLGLAGADDVNGLSDAYRRDLTAGVTTPVSVDRAGQAVGTAGAGPLSADGSVTVFTSANQAVPSAVSGRLLYRWTPAGTTVITQPGWPTTASWRGTAVLPMLSDDGRFVTWQAPGLTAGISPLVARVG